MLPGEYFIITALAITSFLFFIKAVKEVKNKNNPYGLTPYLFFLGAFVWGDVLVLGPFWMIVSFISIILKHFILFLLFISIFWVIRSVGEIFYWLNEQFAGKNLNPPKTLYLHKVVKSDAIWFVYQVFWQCFFVFSLVISIYLCKLWLETF